MKHKFISSLQRRVHIYHFIKILYWKMRSFQNNLFGTKIQEKFWEKRHLTKKGDWHENEDWIEGYWNARFHPHRKFLIKKISRYSPSTILEIGCNCGPNLYLLSKKFPEMKLVGIDINKEAIRTGESLFNKEDIINVELLCKKADMLDRFLDKSFDVVFTDALLLYIGPDKIESIIKEMIRISRKTLIFLEWHHIDNKKASQGLGVYHFGHWKRDYKNLLKKFVAEDKIFITKIPKKIWPDKNWSQLGCIIEVSL